MRHHQIPESDPNINILHGNIGSRAKWQLERLAGAGGMGEVFQGRDLRSGEPVAVKVLQLSHPDQLVRFEREARCSPG